MAFERYEMPDIRNNKSETVIVCLDEDNVAELPCHAKYDPCLSGKKGNKVNIISTAKVWEDGKWKPYPTIVWLDGAEREGQLETRALVKLTGEEGFNIMVSPDGVPDGTLMKAAKEAGIFTQTLDGKSSI